MGKVGNEGSLCGGSDSVSQRLGFSASVDEGTGHFTGKQECEESQRWWRKGVQPGTPGARGTETGGTPC